MIYEGRGGRLDLHVDSKKGIGTIEGVPFTFEFFQQLRFPEGLYKITKGRDMEPFRITSVKTSTGKAAAPNCTKFGCQLWERAQQREAVHA